MQHDARLSRRRFLEATSVAAGASVVGGPVDALIGAQARAQTNSKQVCAVLNQPLQSADVVEYQLRQYLMKRVPPLPQPKSAGEWTAESQKLRKRILDDVIFHGWPSEWVNSSPKFEDMGVLDSGKGYGMRKLRFEIVPDFWSTAILYEPESVSGKIPATLNLNGHSPQGKAADYKQKRCINYALKGMYALSPEWLGMGELNQPENGHWYGAHLNLVGACASGLFYLAMRRGLDYLHAHPKVDTNRLGVTGLSGGAWQTIVLSGLDERVAVAIPVSGYFAFISGLERNSDVGDIEYNPPDFRVNFDYTILTAMRAPRPTLLMYGAEDEYGMRAPLEKPHLYDDIKPFFKLYDKEKSFAWHENIDPGTHNYELDNRQQSYHFFSKHFKLRTTYKEIPVDGEVKSCEELTIGLPDGNLTIVGLARKLAKEAAAKRAAVPTNAAARKDWAQAARASLKQIVRYSPANVQHAWALSSTRNKGLETLNYRVEFENGLTATAVWLKATTSPENAPLALLLDDRGIQMVDTQTRPVTNDPPSLSNCRENAIAWHLNRGEQVLAVNLLFTGDASPEPAAAKSPFGPAALYTQLIASVGERPLGLQAAQLVGVTKWLQSRKQVGPAFLETVGMRNQVAALVATGLESGVFSEVLIRNGMKSFGYLLDKSIEYQAAPDLFCLDLYKEFDIDRLVALAEPVKVTHTGTMLE